MLSGWTRRLLQFLPAVTSDAQVCWYSRRSPMSGIKNKMALSKEVSPWDNSEELPDDDDTQEVDLFEFHKYYDQHKAEQSHQENVGKLKNMERKINPGVVNMRLLSYKAQQQIKYLHETDPESWPEEHLATCFHVTADAITKVLKNKLNFIDTEEKIKRYDAVVLKNWRKLGYKKGPPESTVPSAMVEGLVVSAKPTYVEDKPIGPFQKIYVDHMIKTGKMKSSEEKNRDASDAAEILHSEHDEVFKDLPKIVKGDQFAPVPEKRKVVQVRVASSQAPTHQQTVELPHRPIVKHKPQKMEFTLDKGTDGDLVAYNFSDGGYERPFGWGTKEPDRISIPREKRKRGALYKVGASYYDERGQFLYKIPMSI